MSKEKLSRGQKAARTRKRRAAAYKRIRRAAARKAAATRAMRPYPTLAEQKELSLMADPSMIIDEIEIFENAISFVAGMLENEKDQQRKLLQRSTLSHLRMLVKLLQKQLP